MTRYATIDEAAVQLAEGPEAGLEPGWVRVRVSSCGLCGTDLHLLHGMRLPGGASYPVRPGHEVAGVVVEVGSDADADLLAQQVVLHPLRTCGTCPDCCSGDEQRCPNARILGIEDAGGLADDVVWPASRVVATPGLAPEQAAILADAGATAFRAVRAADLPPQGRLCILGAGGVGTQVAAIARATVPGVQIAAVVGSAASAERLAPLVDTVEVGVTGLSKRMRHAGWQFDTVIDFSGQEDAPAEGARLLRPGGTLILGSVSPSELRLGPGVLLQSRELTVKGVYTSTIDDLRSVVDLVTGGLIDLTGSVTHRFPLDRVQDAFRTLAERPPGMVRVVVTP
jgi:propanol-preferring alcohol dehydrogenase